MKSCNLVHCYYIMFDEIDLMTKRENIKPKCIKLGISNWFNYGELDVNVRM